MTADHRIRFGTNIITFFDSAWWGLGENLSHSDWSWEFQSNPRYYFEGMFDAARDAGLEGIELAPDPAGWEAALSAFGSTFALRSALDERGLVVTSSYAPGRQLIGGAMEDPALEAVADEAFARHAAFLAEMGAGTIVSGNIMRSRFGNNSPDDTAIAEDFSKPIAQTVHERFASQLNRLGAITAKEGVKIAIHTDAYSICSRNEDIATLMSLTDPAGVALCPDAGHITLDGGDPVGVLRDHIDRIPTMHWKDCAAPLSGHLLRGEQKERHAVMLRNFRVMGSGIVNWDEWMRVLRTSGWSGWATEEIDNSPDPVAELKQGLEFFRTQLEPILS